MALVVSMALLTAALILGVSGLQTSRIDEVAAGSNRASVSAFNAAEYGASARLDYLSSNNIEPGDSSLSTCPDPANPEGSDFVSVSNDQDDTVGYYYEECRFDDETIRLSVKGVSGGVERDVVVRYIFPESKFLGLSAINLPTNISGFEAPNSSSFIVEGAVEDSVTGDGRPAISTTSQQSYVEGEIGDSRLDNYVGGVSDSMSESILTDPVLFYQFVNDLIAFAKNELMVGGVAISNDGVGQEISSIDNNTDLGSAGSEKITYYNGDMAVNGNVSGAGILIVDGDYGTSGTPQFDGLVIVLGQVFDLTGGGTGGVDGAVIVAPMEGVEVVNADGETETVIDSDTGLPDANYLDAQVTTSGGGTADFAYDDETLSTAFDMLPEYLQVFWESNNSSTFIVPAISEWKEVM